MHLAQNQTAGLKIAESLRKDGVTNALNSSPQFRESEWSRDQGAENDATPALAEELKSADQSLVAR